MPKPTTQFCDKQYFRFQKVDDYFADFNSWDRIIKASGCPYTAEEWNLVLHLVLTEGKEGDMLFEVFNSSSFRLRFHPCMKEAEYSAYNPHTIVQDEFKDTQKITAEDDLKADFKEEKGKYVEMTIRANPIDGELIVHAYISF